MINEFLKDYKIILASQSPRRQQLLKEAGIDFEVVVKDYKEIWPDHLYGKEIALFLAEQKAAIFKKNISADEIVITADTIVWCNGQVLGKPSDFDDARRILHEISGNTHEVITGVCLLSRGKERSFCVTTKVTFETLSDAEIDHYINDFKPYDKAGAYGIQEWIGLIACSRIEGSYFNVVGLPVHELIKEMKHFVK